MKVRDIIETDEVGQDFTSLMNALKKSNLVNSKKGRRYPDLVRIKKQAKAKSKKKEKIRPAQDWYLGTFGGVAGYPDTNSRSGSMLNTDIGY